MPFFAGKYLPFTMMIESAKIIRFIGIINDYIFDAEKDLEQVKERILFILDSQEA
jgi:hypothetical protein